MKKIFGLALAAVMVLSLAACGEEVTSDTTKEITSVSDEVTPEVEPVAEPEEEPVLPGVPNPMTEVASLEELNETPHIRLSCPEEFTPSDENFAVIDCGDYDIYQYKFTADGINYTYRCASVSDDISGVYGEEGTIFENAEPDALYMDDAEYKAGRWFTLDGQYCLIADGNMSNEYFEEIYNELCDYTKEEQTSSNAAERDEVGTVEDLVGDYQDSVGMRASATVTDNGDGSMHIHVMWADSFDSWTTWEMNATLDGSSLAYTDCTRTAFLTDSESGEDTETVVYTDGEGYFHVAFTNQLSWCGSEADEDCLFEQLPQ